MSLVFVPSRNNRGKGVSRQPPLRPLIDTVPKQENIPEVCFLPAWKPYKLQFQWPPPDVTPRGRGAQMNNFEQVSSDDHQMSLVGPAPVDKMTDRCKNITFATSLRTVKTN